MREPFVIHIYLHVFLYAVLHSFIYLVRIHLQTYPNKIQIFHKVDTIFLHQYRFNLIFRSKNLYLRGISKWIGGNIGRDNVEKQKKRIKRKQNQVET